MSSHRFLAAAAAAVFFMLPAAGRGAIEIDSNTFGALRARAIGPAVMGGRITSLAAVPGETLTLYVGAASGGVWKSTNGGTTFEPVFDDYTQSIGALAVDPSDPERVWVGTGESWVRNSVSVGEGVFRSRDGGETWELAGLADSERVSKIIVHPEDGDTVWVCATGHLWDANEERGVFKTTDGGETWEKVLWVDADTGCADLGIDPQEPDILYAGMWEFRRQPDFFTSGGPGSGLYKTSDGGANWRRIEAGLPQGDLGRIAIAVAPSRPNVVYATVEAEKTALYRSQDLGESWQEVNRTGAVKMRPFYFSHMVVDPQDHKKVFKASLFVNLSTDGGETFQTRGGMHPDIHAIWIHPDNPQVVYLGTDGGLYSSRNGGGYWTHHNNLPISQFYRVSHDMERPYNVYGGLQDNGSWTGPSRAPGGITNAEWKNVGFGDGFWTFPDPRDAKIVYAEFQGGRLLRVERETGEIKWIEPYPEPGQPKLRFNWNAPIHLSPNDPATIYFGSQFLHRSRDRGDSWETISEDLTTNDPAKQRQSESGGLSIDNSTAENHTTIYAIAESPKDPQVIWVGTDDGNLQLTRDGGETWTNVVGNVPDLPPATWVSYVEPSPHDPAVAFVTFDGHRSGDMATYLYRTGDHGATWTPLASDAVDGYAHVVRQDPENPDLLFLGTEFGLFVSLDGGEHWARFKENLPRVSVRAIAIHPAEHDVILGTHGRGVYIIDDITSLRNLTQEVLDSDVALMPTRPAVMRPSSFLQSFPASDEFVGANPVQAAVISYYQKKRHLFGDFKIEIFDQEGELLRALPGRKRPGLNQVIWPMRLKPPRLAASTALVPAFAGPRIPEGTYKVRLTRGKTVLEGDLEIQADPDSPHSPEDRALQQKTALEIYHLLPELTYLTRSVTDLEEDARERLEAAGAESRLGKRLTAFADRLDELAGTLATQHEAGPLSGDEQLRERLGNLYGAIVTYDGRPTDSQLARIESLKGELEAADQAFGELLAELAPLNRELERKGHEPLARLAREDWEAEEGTPAASGAALERLLLAHQRSLAVLYSAF